MVCTVTYSVHALCGKPFMQQVWVRSNDGTEQLWGYRYSETLHNKKSLPHKQPCSVSQWCLATLSCHAYQISESQKGNLWYDKGDSLAGCWGHGIALLAWDRLAWDRLMETCGFKCRDFRKNQIWSNSVPIDKISTLIGQLWVQSILVPHCDHYNWPH